MNSIKVLKKIREIKAKILVKRYDFKVMQGMYWEKKNIARARNAQEAQACSKLPWEYAYQRLRIKKGLVGGKNISLLLGRSLKHYEDTFRNLIRYQNQSMVQKMT